MIIEIEGKKYLVLKELENGEEEGMADLENQIEEEEEVGE